MILKKPLVSDVTTDQIMAALPTLPRHKHTCMETVIDSLTKVTNHRIHILNKQIETMKKELTFHKSTYSLQQQYTQSLFYIETMKKELTFHKSTYSLQQQYTQSLFTAVSEGYSQFEANLSSVILAPLKEVLVAFDSLQTTASEADMRHLLETLQNHHTQLKAITDDLQTSQDQDGSVQLSHFAAQFQESINKLCEKCRRTKNRETRNLKVLMDDQAHLESQLRDVLAECEAKKEIAEKKLDLLNGDDRCSFDGKALDFDINSTTTGKNDSGTGKSSRLKTTKTGYASNRTSALRRDSSKNVDRPIVKEVTGKIGHPDVNLDFDKMALGSWKGESVGDGDTVIRDSKSEILTQNETGEIRVKRTVKRGGKVPFR